MSVANKDMSILVCGINHKTAPVALRERVVFPADKIALFLHDIISEEAISEAMLLSTCNRSELYCNTHDVKKVLAWFSRQHALSENELAPHLYFYQNEQAVAHIMQVACGLDSMVLGESQILGQMKEAFSESSAAGAIGPLFNRLFQQVFAAAKEVRTNTAIGACPVSVSSAAIHFIKQQLSASLSSQQLVLVGAGLTIELVLRHLKNDRPDSILIANRNIDNANALAKSYAAAAIGFEQLPNALNHADIVISATGSTVPIITKEMIKPRNRPLLILDIAVPRDVAINVTDCEHVRLFSIDDLKSSIQHHLRGREHAAEKAHEMIKQKSQEFMVWLNSLDLVHTTIRAYRNHIEELARSELSKATRQLQRGDDPAQVLNAFAYGLTNKLLHTPSVQLRQAGHEGRLELLQLAQQLFELTDSTTELISP